MRANERERGRVKSILVNYLPGFPTRHTTRPGWLPKAEVIHRGDSVLYVHLREGPYNLQGLKRPPTRHDSLLLVLLTDTNLNSRFFKRGQSPVVLLKTRYTPPEAARAIFWLFTPKTVLTTITTLGSGEH